MTSLQIIPMGPPGAGKGTQSRRIASKFDLTHIELGEILRSNKDMETPYGTPREYMEQGELVPDPVMNSLAEETISDADGFILDGYPRTQAQLDFLDEITTIDIVLHIDVSEEILVERLTGRRKCDNCGTTYHVEFNRPNTPGECDDCGGSLMQRDDDTPKTIRTRVRKYEKKTAEIIDLYQNRGSLVTIDGEQPPDAVWDDIHTAINAQK
ncbi:nucleoside monophosphate kinase [Natrinema soli]|uniref:Adenylate kinase n=1 Tax=Natrinema soli TaxID=1930624 RepID=A0ABD5SQZ7_9EURY|nr:nucleoside monophosphate kinase [Natrinema soli]